MLYQQTVTGSYYYDVKNPSCPGAKGLASGYGICASVTPGSNQQTLQQMNTNNIVALDANFFGGWSQRSKWCGKQVVISRNGKQINPPDGGNWFIWDSCGTPGRMDFSFTGLQQFDSNACQDGLVSGLSVTVYNNQVHSFVN